MALAYCHSWSCSPLLLFLLFPSQGDWEEKRKVRSNFFLMGALLWMLLAEQASLCSAIVCAGDYTCKNICYSRSDSNAIQIHAQHAYLSWEP